MLNFSLTDLRYLLALAEEKHFARAAQKCFVSQPTLSIAIKKLEENLGITIFERDNHQILVSPSGAQLIEQAKKILSEAEQLINLAKSQQDIYAQPLRIGAILTIGPYLFPKLVGDIIAKTPQLKLVVEENYTEVLIQKLLAGELDLILLATEVNHHDLVQIELGRDELNLICSTQHKFAKLNKVMQKHLAEETFLLLGNGHCFRDQVLKICPNCDPFKNKIANLITTSSLETIKYMVAMNIGVSILPKLAQHNLPPNLCMKPISGGMQTRTISLVYRRNFTRKSLIDEIQQLLVTELLL
ncbi:MAG: LysR family transcriptional regulator [Burkholderiales bacterium]|jgi:LysR family hydrogen peroxide-inducible transcriptional activator|nr:LysR family transcriptional regulator [Burkholderiales bacterium]MBP9768454.1 LysR family transcriptional regulator [Burkholderiales bacterium]